MDMLVVKIQDKKKHKLRRKRFSKIMNQEGYYKDIMWSRL